MGAVGWAGGPAVGNIKEDFVALSAQECAASVVSDADLVIAAAVVLAVATRRLTASAARTVRMLSALLSFVRNPS